jgi:glycyl-tRNA synthetase beta chain
VSKLLFEIGTEELPSWYPPQAENALREMLALALTGAGVGFGSIRTFSTPRRLALLVEGLARQSELREEKRRGPPVAAAFDAEGRPTRAAAGFAASNSVPVEALVVGESDKGSYVYAVVTTGGVPVSELLPPLLARLVRDVPAPRKMRWADISDAFVRPVAWLLARLDDEILPVSVAGQTAGGVSYGHRFLSPGPIRIEDPASYAQVLQDAFVLADLQGRKQSTLESVTGAAAELGLVPIPDAELLEEVTGLVEHPFPISGSFSRAYLELPDEVLTTVLIVHQRFFPLRDADGRLAASFIGVSNNRVADPAVVRQGYEQVLDGRLYDARFFWDTDRQASLAQHAWGLSGVGYHKDLGSMADKVARVGEAALALAPVLQLDAAEAAVLAQAVPLFRADLVTGMVSEFPELEGVMARAYALAEGLPAAVARVLEDGVLPRGPHAPLPQSEAGAVLSAADRFDKLLGFIALGRRPSGSADPFALRRDAIGLARILSSQAWTVSPAELAAVVAAAYSEPGLVPDEAAIAATVAFLWERVASLLGEEGIPVQVVRAVTADNPAVITAGRRAHLLLALLGSSEFPELAGLYRRAANLAVNSKPGSRVDARLFTAEAEEALLQALPGAAAGVQELLAEAAALWPAWDLGSGPEARQGTSPGGFEQGIRKVLALKAPLDAFLDTVHVMVDDEAVRNNRLSLLLEVRDALRGLGWLEELEGIQGI